ncbi:hypothetical protein [Nonomuraea sp. NPDC052265]|uniref:hypothetical protein n=1 Tax=Nonomuraea sp. NPDC052265 TaxID=3364374 RepID=UPI0037C9D953
MLPELSFLSGNLGEALPEHPCGYDSFVQSFCGAEGKRGAIDSHDLAELEKRRNDPDFAVAFASVMPPRQLKSLLAGLRRAHAIQSTSLDRLARALSTLLGTASRAPGAARISTPYAHRLLENLDDPETGFALGQLLRYGRFADTFLRDLAFKIYDYERSQPPGSPYWRNLRSDSQPMCAIPLDERDPMAAVMAALANHPRAAREFLTDERRDPLEYLACERFWPGGTAMYLDTAIDVAGL